MNYRDFKVVKMGIIDYQEAYNLQEKIHEKVLMHQLGNIFLILEHPPVLTIGISGSEDNILASESFLKERGIDVRHIRRGGDVTYHGPGQIVGYPLFNLNVIGRNVRAYVSRLENTIINLLSKEYQIIAHSNPEFPGVWIEDRKITAVGTRIKKGVSMHGFAFNVNTNMEHFRLITPCGISDKAVTSLEAEIGRKEDMGKVNDLTIRHLAEAFDMDYRIIEKEEFLKYLGE